MNQPDRTTTGRLRQATSASTNVDTSATIAPATTVGTTSINLVDSTIVDAQVVATTTVTGLFSTDDVSSVTSQHETTTPELPPPVIQGIYIRVVEQTMLMNTISVSVQAFAPLAPTSPLLFKYRLIEVDADGVHLQTYDIGKVAVNPNFVFEVSRYRDHILVVTVVDDIGLTTSCSTPGDEASMVEEYPSPMCPLINATKDYATNNMTADDVVQTVLSSMNSTSAAVFVAAVDAILALQTPTGNASSNSTREMQELYSAFVGHMKGPLVTDGDDSSVAVEETIIALAAFSEVSNDNDMDLLDGIVAVGAQLSDASVSSDAVDIFLSSIDDYANHEPMPNPVAALQMFDVLDNSVSSVCNSITTSDEQENFAFPSFDVTCAVTGENNVSQARDGHTSVTVAGAGEVQVSLTVWNDVPDTDSNTTSNETSSASSTVLMSEVVGVSSSGEDDDDDGHRRWKY